MVAGSGAAGWVAPARTNPRSTGWPVPVVKVRPKLVVLLANECCCAICVCSLTAASACEAQEVQTLLTASHVHARVSSNPTHGHRPKCTPSWLIIPGARRGDVEPDRQMCHLATHLLDHVLPLALLLLQRLPRRLPGPGPGRVLPCRLGRPLLLAGPGSLRLCPLLPLLLHGVVLLYPLRRQQTYNTRSASRGSRLKIHG